MSLINDDETDGFSFIWTIQNYSYCVQTIESPTFKLNSGKDHRFHLELNPKKMSDFVNIDYFLVREDGNASNDTLSFALSIRTKKGLFKKKGNTTLARLSLIEGYSAFLEKSQLYQKGPGAFLDADTLTLRCRIWKAGNEKLPPAQCYGQTTIGVERIIFTWKLDNFVYFRDEVTKVLRLPIMTEMPPISMHLNVSKNSLAEESIQIDIKQKNTSNQTNFCTCAISLMDSDKRIVHLVHGKYWFEVKECLEVWKIPIIPISRFLKDEKLYFPNGTLSLQCEFAVSSGVEYNKVEGVKYGITELRQIECSKDSDALDTLKDNLLSIYAKGKMSDLIIRTSSKDFAVHKTILIARSPVFSAMFEYDTKENQTGVIEVDDLEDDTLSRLLLFIYTDTVEDIEWRTATSLYFAADKYGIMALKRICSTFLKDNIDSLNFCDVLVLADLHQDKCLKSTVQDYIFEHVKEVMDSEEWKKLTLENLRLASETMSLFVKNLKSWEM